MTFVHGVFEMNQLDYLVSYKNVVHDYLIYHRDLGFLNKIDRYPLSDSNTSLPCRLLISDFNEYGL